MLDPETMQAGAVGRRDHGRNHVPRQHHHEGLSQEPHATEKAFAGGWFHTGDLAVIDADGYVKIKDRSKDIIISGGENISSLEVEDVLYRHPAVIGAAVVARPDEKWGEVACAFVELKEGGEVTEQEIIEFCRERHGALQSAKEASCSGHCQDLDRQDSEVPIARAGEGVCET